MTTTLERNPVATMRGLPITLLFWGVMLLMSSLPLILWQEGTGQAAPWLLPLRGGLLLALLVASLAWPALKPLRPFLLIFAALTLAEWGAAQLGETALWRGWFGGAVSFSRAMLGTQLLRLLVALAMVGALLGLTRHRAAFFLTAGDPRATAQPVRWLGMDKPTSWLQFGLLCLLASSASLLLFLFLAARPPADVLLRAVPLLPAVLLFAMLNAFSEELSYRATLLATSERAIGARQALRLSALYFGIGHYYGVPYGIAGVLLSTFFGYLLGKGMLETRGLLWPWLIHVVADIWIFAFMAVGSVTPGG